MMAVYNNGFPATYTPYYTQLSVPQQQTSVQGLNWIQGEQAAKSYLVAPNNTVALFDSESQSIYIKSVDASGMPSMKILDYTIRDSSRNAPNSPFTASSDKSVDFVTKDEISAITDEITALRSKVSKLMKKMEADDE